MSCVREATVDIRARVDAGFVWQGSEGEEDDANRRHFVGWNVDMKIRAALTRAVGGDFTIESDDLQEARFTACLARIRRTRFGTP